MFGDTLLTHSVHIELNIFVDLRHCDGEHENVQSLIKARLQAVISDTLACVSLIKVLLPCFQSCFQAT